jgi:hypothetical protein
MSSRCHTATGGRHRSGVRAPGVRACWRGNLAYRLRVTRAGLRPPPVVTLDPLFDAAGAAAMVELCTRFGRYRMYGEHEQLDTDLGRGLLQRHDSFMHFVRTGGRNGVEEPMPSMAARTAYFREEYAYGDRRYADGIEPFLFHEGLLDAARRVHDRPVVEPVIAYANLMVPGQELAVHTDVPEFRGANRKNVPQWLLVVMHHSGLFDEWRLPIATGIAWFHDCAGGELAYWPDGPQRPAKVHAVRHNTAMVLDTDTIFHGVDRIANVAAGAMPHIGPGAWLEASTDDSWALHDATGVELARYPWDELRFSVSWKAYCFADEAERTAWRDHTEDLTYEQVTGRLVDDLRARGKVGTAPVEHTRELGLLMIDEYVRFPGR